MSEARCLHCGATGGAVNASTNRPSHLEQFGWRMTVHIAPTWLCPRCACEPVYANVVAKPGHWNEDEVIRDMQDDDEPSTPMERRDQKTPPRVDTVGLFDTDWIRPTREAKFFEDPFRDALGEVKPRIWTNAVTPGYMPAGYRLKVTGAQLIVLGGESLDLLAGARVEWFRSTERRLLEIPTGPDGLILAWGVSPTGWEWKFEDTVTELETFGVIVKPGKALVRAVAVTVRVVGEILSPEGFRC